MQAVKIGDSSIYGQLTQELKDDERDSPLKLKLKGLAHHISQFGYAGGVLIALAVMLHKAYLYGDFGAYFANTPLLLSVWCRLLSWVSSLSLWRCRKGCR